MLSGWIMIIANMKNYQLKITLMVPNENLEEETKIYEDSLKFGNRNFDRMPLSPQIEVQKNCLLVELNEDQYKAVKAAVFKTFE